MRLSFIFGTMYRLSVLFLVLLFRLLGKCKSPVTLPAQSAGNSTGKHNRAVSCGSCYPCRVAKRNAWIFRLSKERERWNYCYFVTLTYNDDNIPKGVLMVDEDTGEIFNSSNNDSLRKTDLQKFFKRLRKNTGDKFRYYAVGEYGSRTRRPHYHFILFSNLDFALRFSHFVRNRIPLYRSSILEKSWQFGFASISDVTPGRIAYTLKYCTKRPYVVHSTEPQFSVSSKHLGNNVFTPEMVEFWFSSPSNFYIRTNDITIPMPKYYKDILLRDDYDSYRHDIFHHLQSVVADKEKQAILEFSKKYPGKNYDEVVNLYDRSQMHFDEVYHSNDFF